MKDLKDRVPLVILILIAVIPGPGYASEVGTITAVRGRVDILRKEMTIPGTYNEKILLHDTLETKEASRVRIGFYDDSVITLSANTTFIVQKYIEGAASERGSSLFRIMDGKLKALSGQNKLEIHTPTAVAAARGTYFFIKVEPGNGIIVTIVACLEGAVLLSNIDPGIPGTVEVTRGTISKVVEKEAPTPPIPLPKKLLKDFLNCRKVGECRPTEQAQ